MQFNTPGTLHCGKQSLNRDRLPTGTRRSWLCRFRYYENIYRSRATDIAWARCYSRVRNSANSFVRDMPKYLRTSKMSVHGYPADKSIFLLQLETRLTEVTRRDSWHVPCRHRSRRCLSCWGAARCSWSRSLLLFHPSVRAPLLGDNTQFSDSSVSRGRSFCTISNRILRSMLVMFLWGKLWPVGECAFHIQLAKRTLRTSTMVASHLLSYYQLQKLSSPRATRWFGSHSS